MEAKNDVLGDTCSTIKKYLEVKYYCGESSEIATNEAGYYLIENNNGKLVTDISKCNEQNLCILYKCNNEGTCEIKNITGYNITGYFVFNSDGTLLTEPNGAPDNILLHCTGEGAVSCDVDTSTIGYVINAEDKSKYIICKAKANGENECDAYVTPKETLYSVGVLNYIEGNYKLCIDENNLVNVNADNEASYFIDAMVDSTFIHKNNIPRAGQYYVVVNIKSGNIILNAKGNFYNTNKFKMILFFNIYKL